MNVLGVLSEVGCAMQQLPLDVSAMLLMVPTLNVLGVLVQLSTLVKSCLKSDVLDDIDGTAELLARCQQKIAEQKVHELRDVCERAPCEFSGAFHGYAGVVDVRSRRPSKDALAAAREAEGEPQARRPPLASSPGEAGVGADFRADHRPPPHGDQDVRSWVADSRPTAIGILHVVDVEELACALCRALGRRAAGHLARASRGLRRGAEPGLQALSLEDLPDIFVFGGHSQRERAVFEGGSEFDVDLVHRFDASAALWTVAGRMNAARSGCAVAAMGGAVYVVGGGSGGGNGAFAQPLCVADRFWPGSRRWEQLPPLSSPRLGCAAAVAGGVLCVVGGLNDFAPLSSAEAFHADSDAWVPLPSMGRPRFGCAAAAISGSVFAVGGGANQRLRSVECLDMGAGKGAWRPLPPMRAARYGCAATAVGEVLFVLGGSCGRGTPLASVERFDANSRSWSELPTMSVPRVGCAAAVCGSTIFVLGGRSGPLRSTPSTPGERSGAVLADVECLDVGERGSSWQRAPPMPVALAGCAAAVAF